MLQWFIWGLFLLSCCFLVPPILLRAMTRLSFEKKSLSQLLYSVLLVHFLFCFLILFSLDLELPGELITTVSWIYLGLALVKFVPNRLGLVFSGTCLWIVGRAAPSISVRLEGGDTHAHRHSRTCIQPGTKLLGTVYPLVQAYNFTL